MDFTTQATAVVAPTPPAGIMQTPKLSQKSKTQSLSHKHSIEIKEKTVTFVPNEPIIRQIINR